MSVHKLKSLLARVMRVANLNWLAEFNSGTQEVVVASEEDNVELVISDISKEVVPEDYTPPPFMISHYEDFVEHRVELAYQLWNAATTYNIV